MVSDVILLEDLINRLGKGVIALLFEALLFPNWGNLIHTLEVQPVAAHRAGLFGSFLIPVLDTLATERMTADELAVGSIAVADSALHF
jgi:hypothetical protein